MIALGAASGLTIGMIFIKDIHDEENARRIFSEVVLSSVLILFVSITVGGMMVHFFSWKMINLVTLLYSILLLCVTFGFEETLKQENVRRVSPKYLLKAYRNLLQNNTYLVLILINGLSICISYVFNGLAPLVVIKNMGLSAMAYGWLSFVPALGMIIGGAISSRLAKRVKAEKMIIYGTGLVLLSSLILSFLFFVKILNIYCFYALAIVIFTGNTLLLANAAMQALASVTDHANAASLMNFIGLVVGGLGVSLAGKFISASPVVLPVALFIASALCGVFMWINHEMSSKR
jgi:Na+/melibiose symporter-like transporter